MLLQITGIQLIVFVFFFILERRFPHIRHPIPKYFTFWWCALGIFALIWLRQVFFAWPHIETHLLSLPFSNPLAEGAVFYLFYSFGNYWFHRWKHSNHFLWRFVHKLHHSPSHMETKMAFYRHPIEIAINTVYLIVLGKLLLNISTDALAVALAIEGCLECFHHSNIAFSKRFRWLGHVIQLPGMHLIHHELGLHRYNYGPFLWDGVFNTLAFPEHWNEKLGFKNSNTVIPFLLCKSRD